jgi:hypothetical protein
MARDLFEAGRTMTYNELVPNYMRKAEAERRLEEGTLKRRG